MNGRDSVRVENEAVTVRPGLVPSVRRHNQQGEGAILKLVAHLCDGFWVASSTIVHALSDELDFPHAVWKEQAIWTKITHLGASLAEHGLRPVRTGQTALRPEFLDLERIVKRKPQNWTTRYSSNLKKKIVWSTTLKAKVLFLFFNLTPFSPVFGSVLSQDHVVCHEP